MKIKFKLRVRSWLRINAGGAHKTCKSNGSRYIDFEENGELVQRDMMKIYNNGFSGGLVSNT